LREFLAEVVVYLDEVLAGRQAASGQAAARARSFGLIPRKCCHETAD
jgi:hypothetical protein